MAQFKLKNGHTLELSGGRQPITGTIEQDRYDALVKENPNFEAEFVEVVAEPVKVSKQNKNQE